MFTWAVVKMPVSEAGKAPGCPGQVAPTFADGAAVHTQGDDKSSNPMREMRVSKLVINCCVGESGDRLQKAAKVRPQAT